MRQNKKTYISLFSSAGVGCFGFKEAGFDCVATNEIIERRLDVQKANCKCKYPTGYICGDIQQKEIKQKIFNEIKKWKNAENVKEIDVIIATPPCQGMSVANHKKKNEQIRNSLIIESIKIVDEIEPRYFIFENVKAFLSTACTNIDGNEITISDAIDINLESKYNILKKVINFKDYGANSSRTRTVVIGVRRDINDITPYDLFPSQQNNKTLRTVIGSYKTLSKMGEISNDDIFHSFRVYSEHMLNWIKDIKEGESAFDNKNPNFRPHKIIDGEVIYNANKNGDKYTRCIWDKVAPCIHTRNDILASQSTIHPSDNRVFSIRELMELMTIPPSFKWTNDNLEDLNKLSLEQKRRYLKLNEINIRQSIGEAVPTVIFKQIAEKIISAENSIMNISKIKKEIADYKLTGFENLVEYINNANKLSPNLFKIVEYSNAKRIQTSAYYTRRDIGYSLINNLPDFKNKKVLNIIEPSVGIGNFIFLLFEKYSHIEKVNLDIVDIDGNSLFILKLMLDKIKIPPNFNLTFISKDFLEYNFNKHYDLAIGNPPFGKVKDSKKLKLYKQSAHNSKTCNIFSFFIEKCSKIADYVALITPKSLLSTPEFNLTRELLARYNFRFIQDYGELAFKGVKIETISFMFEPYSATKNNTINILSYITKQNLVKLQSEVFDEKFPFWIIYRNDFFESICQKLIFNVFDAFRDRQITKQHTKGNGKIRVLKARNIKDNKIININNYDSFIDDVELFASKKYLNETECILVPNLSYYPRACFKPKNTIADGSVAILKPKNQCEINESDLSYFSSNEFTEFYKIARNYGTRSLNIDSNAVYFWGIRKKENV